MIHRHLIHILAFTKVHLHVNCVHVILLSRSVYFDCYTISFLDMECLCGRFSSWGSMTEKGNTESMDTDSIWAGGKGRSTRLLAYIFERRSLCLYLSPRKGQIVQITSIVVSVSRKESYINTSNDTNLNASTGIGLMPAKNGGSENTSKQGCEKLSLLLDLLIFCGKKNSQKFSALIDIKQFGTAQATNTSPLKTETRGYKSTN